MHFCFWINAEHAKSFRILERKCSAKKAAQSTIASGEAGTETTSGT
jgi:hypothetical protein